MKLREPRTLVMVVGGITLLALASTTGGQRAFGEFFRILSLGLLCWAAWRRGRLADRYAQLLTAGLLLALVGTTLLAAAVFPIGAVLILVAALACWLGAFTSTTGVLRAWQPFAAAGVVTGACLLVLQPALTTGQGLLALAIGALLTVMLGQAQARAAAAPRVDTRYAATGANLLLVAAFALAIEHLRAPSPHSWIVALLASAAGQTLLVLSIPDVEPEADRRRLHG